MAYCCYSPSVASADVRLAELLGALSLACDIAFGFPLEKSMRSCVLGVELGRRHGLSEEALRDVYYTVLLGCAGATAFSHEAAAYACGDDIGLNRALADLLSDASRGPGKMSRFLRKIGDGAPALERARALTRLTFDFEMHDRYAHSVCDLSVHLAALVGLSSGVRAALTQLCETWDGKGAPRKTKGEALHLPIRIEHIADFGEIAHHRDGRAAAVALVKRQAGRHFDPELAKTFLGDADELLAGIEGGSIWERFLAAEPAPRALASEHRIDDLATAFAELADVKSVWTLDHSTGVAALATRAAEGVGMPTDEIRQLRRAALLHDLGRVSAPNRIWDKPAALSPSDWEVVRMHAYWTERVLTQSPLLGDLARLASGAHERLDGAGYHRALPSPMLGRAARLLAAADAYHAMREPRPYRPARSAAEASRALLDDVAAGRLDREAAHATLDAAGVAAPRTPASWPCGLTDREVEVLRLLARGRSNKEIGSALGISPRTAQHHVIHIYQKIDVASRAAAALFATENGLLDALG